MTGGLPTAYASAVGCQREKNTSGRNAQPAPRKPRPKNAREEECGVPPHIPCAPRCVCSRKKLRIWPVAGLLRTETLNRDRGMHVARETQKQFHLCHSALECSRQLCLKYFFCVHPRHPLQGDEEPAMRSRFKCRVAMLMVVLLISAAFSGTVNRQPAVTSKGISSAPCCRTKVSVSFTNTNTDNKAMNLRLHPASHYADMS